jgi:hypothetical protein
MLITKSLFLRQTFFDSSNAIKKYANELLGDDATDEKIEEYLKLWNHTAELEQFYRGSVLLS